MIGRYFLTILMLLIYVTYGWTQNTVTAPIKQFREGSDQGVWALAFSPDGSRLFAGLNDYAVLWDVKTGETIRVFDGHLTDISRVAFSPDGRMVLTGSPDQTAKLWDVETGKEIRTFDGYEIGP